MKSEDELIEEVLEGNTNSFEPLLRPYQRGLLNMAYRMTGNLEEAKEVCQETLFKIFRHLHSFRKGSNFKNWIYKTVVNASYDFMRKRKKFEAAVNSQKEEALFETLNPEELYSRREIGEKITLCLSSLSPREKAAFLLRDQEGFSIKETSQILGCSSMSVRTHLSKARHKIRGEFKKIYPFKAKEVKV